jgi:hypothetical protein
VRWLFANLHRSQRQTCPAKDASTVAAAMALAARRRATG